MIAIIIFWKLSFIIQYFILIMLIPNNSTIPSTSTKLNFYLAQINRNRHGHGQRDNNHSSNHNKFMQQKDDSLEKINKSMDNHLINLNTKFHINLKKHGEVKYKGNNYLNDSLDVLMTDRENNIDTILLSPKNSNNSNTINYNKSNLSC